MGSKAPDTSGYGEAAAAQNRQLDEIKRVSQTAPSEEALKIKDFEEYDLEGLLGIEDYGLSAFENVEADPRLQQAQMQALQELQSRGAEGLTPEEREQYRQFQEDASAQEMARQASLAQQFAQTGQGGAGLAAQIASSQAAAQRQSEGGRQMGADIAAARRAALEQSAGVASNMSQQDMAQQQALASARDEFSKLGTVNRQNVNAQNLQSRQRIGEQNVDLENQRRLQNIEATQQAYQNRISPLSLSGQASNTLSSIGLAKTQMRGGADKGKAALGGAASGAAAGTAIAPGYGTAIGAGIGGLAGYMSAKDGGIVKPEYANGGYVRSRATQNEIDASKPMSFSDMQQADRENIINDPINKQDQERLAITAGLTPLSNDSGDLSRQDQLMARMQAQDAAQNMVPQQAESSPDMMGAISGGAQLLGNLVGNNEAPPSTSAPMIDSGSFGDADPGNLLGQTKLQGTRFAKNPRLADGGFTYADGGLQHDGSGDVVPGNSFAGDRVDAKLNSAEMVLNVDQQQRLLDLIKGLKNPQELPNEDIVLQANGAKATLPPVQGEDTEARGLKKLIKMLGME